MKIRTDFVTNSSSSSFILSLKFELTNGECITWEGMSDVGEGSCDYMQLSARKSPKELGSCTSVPELIAMLKDSIGQGLKEYEDFGEGFESIFTDEENIIKSLSALSSMEDIAKITIEGYEETFDDYEDGPYAKDDIVTYDMKSKEETATLIGTTERIECEGTGGALDFEHHSKHIPTPEGYFEKKRELFVVEDEVI